MNTKVVQEISPEKYLCAKMSTVLSFSLNGFTTEDMKSKWDEKLRNKWVSEQMSEHGITKDQIDLDKMPNTKYDEIEKIVEKKVKDIIGLLKASHGKFEDPDFGPTASDKLGALSLYGKEGRPE